MSSASEALIVPGDSPSSTQISKLAGSVAQSVAIGCGARPRMGR